MNYQFVAIKFNYWLNINKLKIICRNCCLDITIDALNSWLVFAIGIYWPAGQWRDRLIVYYFKPFNEKCSSMVASHLAVGWAIELKCATLTPWFNNHHLYRQLWSGQYGTFWIIPDRFEWITDCWVGNWMKWIMSSDGVQVEANYWF